MFYLGIPLASTSFMILTNTKVRVTKKVIVSQSAHNYSFVFLEIPDHKLAKTLEGFISRMLEAR